MLMKTFGRHGNLNYLEAHMKIITTHVSPPIPVRCADWLAYRAGTEEDGPWGWGETEAAAINDLIEQETEND